MVNRLITYPATATKPPAQVAAQVIANPLQAKRLMGRIADEVIPDFK